MRIQVELKRDAIPQVVLNKLFKHTGPADDVRLQRRRARRRRPAHAVAPRADRHYLDYQREIVTRRSKYELRQAEKRAHILQGYLIALDNLDAVIALIRGSDDTDQARTGLIETFASPRSRPRRSSTSASRGSPGSRARRSRRSTPTSRSGSPSSGRSSATPRGSTR